MLDQETADFVSVLQSPLVQSCSEKKTPKEKVSRLKHEWFLYRNPDQNSGHVAITYLVTFLSKLKDE